MERTLLINSAICLFPHRNWKIIKRQCKGKSGVYGFINNINGNCYVGSAVNLYERLRDYHQPWYLESKKTTLICRALVKYGINNFTIVILEYTELKMTTAAEQGPIDKFAPKYNILSVAANSLGYKHTEENKLKISKIITGKTRSLESRNEMSERQQGSGNTFFGKNHSDYSKALLRKAALTRIQDPNPGFLITVLDNHTKVSNSYKSLRAASRVLGCSHGHLAKYHNRLYRNRYFITIVK